MKACHLALAPASALCFFAATLASAQIPAPADTPPPRANRPPVIHTLSPGPDLGYTYNANPLPIPENLKCKVTAATSKCGLDGWAFQIGSVAMDAKRHIFVAQRAAEGPQILEFDQNRRFVRSFGDGLTLRAHGMHFDAQGHLWLCDQWGHTVTEMTPSGKVIRVFGERGVLGDWDESKGTHLLFAPLDIAFGPKGDFYISMGHGRESAVGHSSRILHLDKNGKFINQWFGNVDGPGEFGMAHSIVINPNNGNLYIADREDKHIVVYTGDGKFVKTIQMANLVCAFKIIDKKTLWMSTGQDGQIEKIDWDGNVLGWTGVGPGAEPGQFGESNFMVIDAGGNIIVGDTALGRVQEMVAPKM
jgi:hypothetical protein